MKISEFVKRYVSGENYEHPYDIWGVYHEVIEVFQARSLQNLKEELNDVSFTFQAWLHLKAPFIDWEMFWQERSIEKMEDRLQWWSDHFSKYNLSFHPKYWEYGSNYKKEYKVNLALAKAMKEQGVGAVKNAFESVYEMTEKKIEQAKDVIQHQGQNVKDALQQGGQNVKEFVSAHSPEVIDGTKKVASFASDAAVSTASIAAKSAKFGFSHIYDKTKKLFRKE
jgi:hypothetical protein